MLPGTVVTDGAGWPVKGVAFACTTTGDCTVSDGAAAGGNDGDVAGAAAVVACDRLYR